MPAPLQIVPADDVPWQDTPHPGLRLKPVRQDEAQGLFLGLLSFAPMARSGLHQHQGVATSFIAAGGLSDYQGAVRLHEAGINLAGATHDAISYEHTLLVSRLEGPVVYPPDSGPLTGLHTGSRHGAVANPAAEVPPDLNVAVDALPRAQTGIIGLVRQGIFDYAGTGSAHRFVQLRLAPGTECPVWRAGGLTEFWIRGGQLVIDGATITANTFVIIQPGTPVRMASPHGVLLLAWADGPEQWPDGDPATPGRSCRASLFGF